MKEFMREWWRNFLMLYELVFILPFVTVLKTTWSVFKEYESAVCSFLTFVAKFVTLLVILHLYNQTTLFLQPYLGHTPVRYHLILRELTGVPDP